LKVPGTASCSEAEADTSQAAHPVAESARTSRRQCKPHGCTRAMPLWGLWSFWADLRRRAMTAACVTVRHMAPKLGEPDCPEICPTTTYFKLFHWRPTCDHLVAHQPQPQSRYFPGIRDPPSGPLLKGQSLCEPDLDYRRMLLRAPDPGAPRGCHVAPLLRLYSRRYSKLRPSSGLWAPWALRGGFSEGSLRVSEEGFPRVL